MHVNHVSCSSLGANKEQGGAKSVQAAVVGGHKTDDGNTRSPPLSQGPPPLCFLVWAGDAATSQLKTRWDRDVHDRLE